jgi:hypothetical protein
VFLDVGHSLWREDGSVVYNCWWRLPVQSFSGQSPVGLTTIFYCLTFETSLSVASYDSQGYGGGIWPRLHTGYRTPLPTLLSCYNLGRAVEKSPPLWVSLRVPVVTICWTPLDEWLLLSNGCPTVDCVTLWMCLPKRCLTHGLPLLFIAIPDFRRHVAIFLIANTHIWKLII